MGRHQAHCDHLIGIEPTALSPFLERHGNRTAGRCRKSGVIFLSRTDHMDISHYAKKESFQYWGVDERRDALRSNLEDDQRRQQQFQQVIGNRKWLDVGTGAGGVLDLLSPAASATFAVEPQEHARNALLELGYDVYASVAEVPEEQIEVVTLFHVLEHLTRPIETLRDIKETMVAGGKLIVEVPHANDFLMSFLDLDAFKSCTFWSEHLILHTRQSLQVFIEESGFKNVVVEGYQRYPLANHLYWLSKGKPGGHIEWSYLRTPEFESAYARMLAALDNTDTLIATAVA